MSTRRQGRIFSVFKWFALVVLFLLLLGTAGSWFISYKYKPTISRMLSELVINSTDSLYTIKFSRINTNFLTGRAAISDVEIVPVPAIYDKLVKLQKAPDNIYRLKLKKMIIRKFHPWTIYAERKLNISELLFERPDLEMVNKQYDFNENRPPRPRVPPYQFISKFLKEARIHEIKLTDIRFRYVNNNGAVPEIDTVDNLNIYLSDYLVDERSARDTTRMYLFKDLRIALNNYSYITADKMYKLSLEQLDFTALGGKLNISKFAMEPMYPEFKFGQVAGYARDRFEVKMNDLSLSGIILPRYVRKRELYAEDMHIQNGSVKVFADNSLPKRIEDKTGKFPHQLLQKLNTLITVRKINLKEIFINYAEFDADSRQRGQISFERTAGTITNATNLPSLKATQPVMKADLTTWLMGKGEMKVRFDFDLLAPKGDFAFSGHVGPIEGRFMNRITKPLGMVAVNRGKVKALDFSVRANADRATGKMAFAYNDLGVSVLKKDKTKNRLVRQGLVSFLANNLVLSADNPDATNHFVKAPINYTRPETASFFSYVWRSLFTGIKYSVGVTPAKEADIRSKMAQFEQMKADRNQRREAREKRKALR